MLIVKAKARLIHAKPLDPLDEPAPIRAAAEFAVGDDFQPDVFLQLDRAADRRVLFRNEALLVELAGMKSAKRLTERRRAQQTADDVGAERRVVHGGSRYRRPTQRDDQRHNASSSGRIICNSFTIKGESP